MAGVPDSIVKENAREQLLSSDLNRMQVLASRDRQNRAGDQAGSFDSNVSSPTSAANLLAVNGAPIDGFDLAPTFVFLSGYQVTIGAGRGFLNYPSFVGLTADDSSNLVMRWASQAVTFAAPHATLGRIDVVIATPGAVDADLQSRQTLVDPVTRAIAPANVFKTTNPTSTLSVVTGAAGANPVPPAIPAGTMPVFYVWAVPSAPTAATFGVCRANWRRAPFPFSAISGVLSGMGLKWDLTADPASTSAIVASRGLHRILIDGELLEFWCNFDSTSANAMVVSDSTADPFGSSAPVGAHRPYYFYAVGGRHNPKPSRNSFDGTLSPVTLVESTVAPDVATGRPSANLTVGGTTVTPFGAVYIGLGFVAKNTTRRLACIMDEEMTIFGSSSDNTAVLTKAGSGAELIGAPANRPAVSTRARVAVIATTADATIKSFDIVPDGGGGAVAPSWTGGFGGFISGVFASGVYGGDYPSQHGIVSWPAAANANLWVSGGVAGDTFQVRFFGYNHRVTRLGAVSVNP